MPDVVLTARAERDLGALPKRVRPQVIDSITEIGIDPEGRGKALVGRLAGLFSARVGSYRIIYSVESRRIIVRAISHRAVAYSRRRRRRT